MNSTITSFGSTENKLSRLKISRVQKILLLCGILAPLVYIATNIICVIEYKGYSAVNQTVSELSAIGTPTRTLWVSLASIYSVLMIAFSFGVFISAKQNKFLRRFAISLFITMFIGFFWPPMHQREVLAAGNSTLTDTLHIVFTFITVPLMMLQIIFGALAFRNRFRLYSIASLTILIIAGIITGLDGSKVSKNLPTPFIGVWERINIAVYMLWIIVLAIAILRQEISNHRFPKFPNSLQ